MAVEEDDASGLLGTRSDDFEGERGGVEGAAEAEGAEVWLMPPDVVSEISGLESSIEEGRDIELDGGSRVTDAR